MDWNLANAHMSPKDNRSFGLSYRFRGNIAVLWLNVTPRHIAKLFIFHPKCSMLYSLISLTGFTMAWGNNGCHFLAFNFKEWRKEKPYTVPLKSHLHASFWIFELSAN